MTKDERSSINNGIWLCSDHAALIDVDVEAYPAALLHRFKERHERLIELRQAGRVSGHGALTRVTLSGFVFQPEQCIDLYGATGIRGDNSSGKTAFLELLHGFLSRPWLERWKTCDAGRSVCDIEFLSDVKRNLKVSTGDGDLRFFMDDALHPGIRPPWTSLFLRSSDVAWRALIGGSGTIDELSTYFEFTPSELVGLVEVARTFAPECGYRLQFEDGELHAQADHHDRMMPFAMLSSSEQAQVVLELALRIAALSSRCFPTVLLIDGSSVLSALDEPMLKETLRALGTRQRDYQVIVTLPTLRGVDSAQGFNWYDFKRDRATGRTTISPLTIE